jgi:hypothetical protein
MILSFMASGRLQSKYDDAEAEDEDREGADETEICACDSDEEG